MVLESFQQRYLIDVTLNGGRVGIFQIHVLDCACFLTVKSTVNLREKTKVIKKTVAVIIITY